MHINGNEVDGGGARSRVSWKYRSESAPQSLTPLTYTSCRGPYWFHRKQRRQLERKTTLVKNISLELTNYYVVVTPVKE
jgi:hypothetical protein